MYITMHTVIYIYTCIYDCIDTSMYIAICIDVHVYVYGCIYINTSRTK